VREAIAFLLLACACGAATWSGRSSDARKAQLDDEGSGPPGSDPNGAAAAHEPQAAFASLESLAPSLAPGMRLAAERESSGERIELVHATGKDTCVRVAFEAAAPVVARLLGADGTSLYEMHVATTTGVLGERGPVCVRKSDIVSAVAEGGGGRIRWIAWAAP
jgi:hypothetical protein